MKNKKEQTTAKPPKSKRVSSTVMIKVSQGKYVLRRISKEALQEVESRFYSRL